SGSYEMFKAMKEAGCDSILFGFESANQRILDYYCKRITPELSRKTVEAARRAGISCIIGTFLLGAPDETYEEAKRTVDFGSSLDLDALILFSLSVKPNTPIWNELKEKGYLTDDFIEKRWEVLPINIHELNSKLSKRELDTLIEDGYTKFLWRREYLAKHIYRNFRHRFRRMWMAKNLRAIAPFLKASLKTRMMK
ncbi:MAG: radical SAM protein, partial [Methanocellales archaeon]|nr:radical SAM protein [Methanocellales archaeon]